MSLRELTHCEERILQKEEKMVLGQHRSAVGTFLNRIDAEHALNELLGAGFPMAQICVVSTDVDRDQPRGGAEMSDVVGYTVQEGVATGATIAGSMLGAIGGCLMGIGMLVVPGVGAVVAVGTSATALVMTLAGAGIGLSCGGLIEALAGLGILADRATVDGDRFSQGEYLVMVDGTDDEVRRAEYILSKSYSRKVWVW